MVEPYLPLTHMLWGPPEMSYLQLCPCGPSSLFLNRNIISQSQQTIQILHCDIFSISFPWQQLLGFWLCTLEDHLNWFWFCSAGVSFLFWGEEQKIETYANSFRLWQSWCCCSWKGFWSYLVNSLAEFTQRPSSSQRFSPWHGVGQETMLLKPSCVIALQPVLGILKK